MAKISSIKKESMTEQSTAILKDFIINGELKAGDFLPPEMDLCKQLGIGRSTLREAVKTLELQGFVKKKHGVGVMIVEESDRAAREMLRLMLQRSQSSLSELYEVRSSIELKTVVLASENATSDERDKINNFVRIMQDNVTTVKEYQKADMDFHMAIAEASHNNLFVFILRAIRPLMEDMILKTIKEERPEHSLGLHEKISKAISTGDTEEALSAMKKHLEAGKYMSNH